MFTTCHDHILKLCDTIRRFHPWPCRASTRVHRGRHKDVPQCAPTRIWAGLTYPTDTQSNPQRQNTETPSKSAAQSRCRGPERCARTQCEHAAERCRFSVGSWRGGSGDGGNGGGDDGSDHSVDGRGITCASRAETGVSIQVRADGSTSRDARMWAGAGGRTIVSVVVLAVQEESPSPVLRLGPVRATGRASRSRAQAPLVSPAAAHLTRSRCRWQIASPARVRALVSR